MFKGSRRYWLMAIFFGLIASVLSFYYLESVKEKYRPDDLVQIVKAKVDIPRDSTISSDQVETTSVPRKYAHPNAQQEKTKVIGKIATREIAAGEEILSNHLLNQKDKADRLAYAIPDNKRAVSIPVDDISGVGGYIKAGDHVDVMATIDIPVADSQGMEKATAYSVLALQDIQVLAVGESPEAAVKKNSSAAKTLTLAVTTEEAQPLILASERGTLRLMLRSPVDQTKSITLPYQIKDFLSE